MTVSELAAYLDQTLSLGDLPSPFYGTPNHKEFTVRNLSISPTVEGDQDVAREPLIQYSIEGIQPNIPEFNEYINRLRQLAAFPQVYRLNYVKQLSTTSFAAALGGSHSRLEHVLGSFDVAVALGSILNDFMKGSEVEDHRASRRFVIRALLLLAFCHDLGHPPFGHVLDSLMPMLLPSKSSDRLDKAALRVLLGEAAKGRGRLFEILDGHLGVATSELEQLLTWCSDLVEAIAGSGREIPSRYTNFAFIMDILDSRIDHDRLDYVARDYCHLVQVSGSAPYSIREVVGAARFVPHESQWRLAFGEEAASQLEVLLRLRQSLYARVYEAREKAAHDQMVLHAVFLLLKSFGCFRQPSGFEMAEFERMALQFLGLSDQDLFQLVERVPTTPRTALARILLKEVALNNPFRTVKGGVFTVGNKRLAHLQLRYTNLDREFKRNFGEGTLPLPSLTGGVVDRDDVLSRLREFLSQSVTVESTEIRRNYEYFADEIMNAEGRPSGYHRVDAAPEEHTYWVLRLFGGDAVRRDALERYVWNALRERWSGFGAWASEVAERAENVIMDPTASGDERASFREDLVRTLREEPFVFAAMSRPVADDVIGQRLFERGRERGALIVGRDGKIRDLRAEGAKDRPNFWLSFLRPASMPPHVDDIIGGIVRGLILEGEWILAYKYLL